MIRYITISSIIISIMALSLRDSMELVHSLLHQIPGTGHMHALGHVHKHVSHHHNVMDHISADAQMEKDHSPEKKSKQSIKSSTRINWFICSTASGQVPGFSYFLLENAFLFSDHYKTLLSAPPFPPPESV